MWTEAGIAGAAPRFSFWRLLCIKLSSRSSKSWGTVGSKLLGSVKQCLASGRACDGGRARGTMRCRGKCWGHHMVGFYGARASNALGIVAAEKCSWGTWPTIPAFRLMKEGGCSYPVRISQGGCMQVPWGIWLSCNKQARQQKHIRNITCKSHNSSRTSTNTCSYNSHSNSTRGALVISRVRVVLLQVYDSSMGVE